MNNEKVTEDKSAAAEIKSNTDSVPVLKKKSTKTKSE